jgi:hypothetical protein
MGENRRLALQFQRMTLTRGNDQIPYQTVTGTPLATIISVVRVAQRTVTSLSNAFR